MKPLFDDGNEHVYGDGDPDLSFHRIFGSAVEGFDPQMLFDPLEEDFDLPPAFVEFRNGGGRQGEMVGKKDESFVLAGIVEADAPEFLRIILFCVEAVQGNDLVALKARGFVDRLGIEPFELEVLFGPDDEEGRRTMDSVKTGKVRIAPIEDIDGACFDRKIVEDIDLVDFSVGNHDNRRNASPQIEERMQLYRTLPFAKQRPGEKRKTQIDRGGIQGVDGLIQFDSEGFSGVEASGFANEDMSEVGIDAPIADLVGMGKGVAGYLSANPQMVELLLG